MNLPFCHSSCGRQSVPPALLLFLFPRTRSSVPTRQRTRRQPMRPRTTCLSPLLWHQRAECVKPHLLVSIAFVPPRPPGRGDDHHQICRLGVCLFSTHVPCGGIDRVRTPLATLTSDISLSPVSLPVWQQQHRQLINHKQMVCVRMWHRGGSFWCVRCQLLPSFFLLLHSPCANTGGAVCVWLVTHACTASTRPSRRIRANTLALGCTVLQLKEHLHARWLKQLIQLRSLPRY